MAERLPPPRDVDAYIAAFSPEVQLILGHIRSTIRDAAPAAEESISYRMPTYVLLGPLVHFAAFKSHIGFYPPVRGDAKLQQSVARYTGEKGNLKFPLDQPIPTALIRRIVRLRVRQNRAKAKLLEGVR